MRLVPLAFAVSAAFLGAAPAGAAVHADPAGDNCKDDVFATFCGFDISSATDTADANGTVHLSLSYVARNCDGNGASLESRPSFEIYDSATTAPAPFGSHMLALLEPAGTTGYQIRQFASGKVTATTAVVPATVLAAGTTTFDVPVPPAVAGALGAFHWLGSNSCIGESPSEASDIAPSTGLYAHATGAGGGGGVTAASVTGAVNATLAATKPASATKLLAKGGFPVTLNAPAAGKLKATLRSRRKFFALAGAGNRVVAQAAKPVTIANLTLTIGKAGKVTAKVKLTRVGRKLLKNAKKTISATLTISFQAGALTATKSKTAKISPRKR